MALTCADCGKRMYHKTLSLPQGFARCHPCRRANPRPQPRIVNPRVATKRGACSTCGVEIWAKIGKCQACCHTRGYTRSDPYLPCVDCGGSAYGVRCRTCSGIARRIRAIDDTRVTRHLREMAAPGLNQTARKALLARWKRQSRACSYCSAPATTIDHVVPLVRGGTNYEGNLVPCCRPCNSSKAARFVIEWRPSSRFLDGAAA